MAFIPANQIFINNLLNEVAVEQENHRDRIFYEKRDPFDDLSERMFIKRFRLSKVAAQHLYRPCWRAYSRTNQTVRSLS